MNSKRSKRDLRISRTIGLAGLFLALGGNAGCLVDANDPARSEDAGAAVSGLDEDALDNALLNEREMKTHGYSLIGRVWFRPDVQLSVYGDPNGAQVVLINMRAGTTETLADRTPAIDEPFPDYVRRVAAGKSERPLDIGSEGLNVALFDAPEPSTTGDVASTRSALVGFESCSSAWFDARCGEWAGISGSTLNSQWRITDLRSSNTQTLNTTGVMAVGCADRGSSTMRVTNTNARFGPNTGSFEVTLNQGFVQVGFNVAAWRQRETCKTRVLGVCVDYHYRIELANFDSSVRITPGANAEAMWCGKFTKRADYTQGDIPCQDILTCPLQCAPGDTRCLPPR